ncbi:fimbrial protein [Lysobacter concretionis Ko07 = DSM 16239]|jgi:type IV pilus assembly protein PilN|uniref:Fimbrial protein n=1 Tax=Lysobacter concretionis Ko07 = DSM 16239 TaxID=1122185 RepID=A0A0A0EKN7_9GAMM|nr:MULTISPECIES: PilN domain-containing protein [Lysobacter]KGM51571.1 fimbrial protein [Lysobacter concretionis Ko07 = DSM 16239]QOD90663.1 PilN domain-containing protein [Lysobacter sp. CW239]
MARINLLPWRAERRKQRQKDAMLMLALSALAAVVLSFLIVGYHNAQIDGQNERNSFLKARIAEVDKQIEEIDELDRKKSKLLARKEVIEELQANRSQMVHLFDSLVRTIPDGVILTSIKQDSETLTLEGRSQSNARVSTYMRNLEGSGWMTRPELSIIEAKGFDKGLPYEFKLQVKLANPNAPTDEDGDGVPDPVTADAAVQTTESAPAPADSASTAPADAADAATPADSPAAEVETAAAPATGADS